MIFFNLSIFRVLLIAEYQTTYTNRCSAKQAQLLRRQRKHLDSSWAWQVVQIGSMLYRMNDSLPFVVFWGFLATCIYGGFFDSTNPPEAICFSLGVCFGLITFCWMARYGISVRVMLCLQCLAIFQSLMVLSVHYHQ